MSGLPPDPTDPRTPAQPPADGSIWEPITGFGPTAHEAPSAQSGPPAPTAYQGPSEPAAYLPPPASTAYQGPAAPTGPTAYQGPPVPPPYPGPLVDPGPTAYQGPSAYSNTPGPLASQIPPAAEHRPLADRIPGAQEHGAYNEDRFNRHQRTPGIPTEEPTGRRRRPSGWNAPAYGMLVLFLLALAALVIPQYNARRTEHKIKPITTALAHRPAGARCPRYITQVFTDVGSVSLDSNGTISDHTDLTGPICSGMKRLLTPAGRAEMRCLVTDGVCPKTVLRSVIALSTVTHESMHLRGILDEAAAECASIGEGTHAGVLAGLTPDEGRMIGYLHLTALNPNTPEQYHVDQGNCPAAADLLQNPPGTPSARGILTIAATEAWDNLASGK